MVMAMAMGGGGNGLVGSGRGDIENKKLIKILIF